jgi:hypothetical protein
LAASKAEDAAGERSGRDWGRIERRWAVTVRLGRPAVIDWKIAAWAVISAALLFALKINATWLVVGAAWIGLIAAPLK